MATLITTYRIGEQDKLIVAKAQIKIETYLIATFVANLCDVDYEFAKSLRIADFRVKKRESEPETYTVWLVGQDLEKCQEIIKNHSSLTNHTSIGFVIE